MQQSGLREFIIFFKEYLKIKLLNFGRTFENIKNIIVAFLIAKRGRYSTSFLNTSFFILVIAVIIAGPTLVENNPFVNSYNSNSTKYQAAILSYNPYESSLTTLVSVKPRDKIIDYKVNEGDTLASIAKKFDISVETIKWANDLKSDTIKVNQILKIPPITGVVHKVKSGDNIYSIAKKYNVDPQKIVNFPFNDFVDMDTFTLAVGQVLYVPDGIIKEESLATPCLLYTSPSPRDS